MTTIRGRTRKEIRRFDLFKQLITLSLLAAAVVFLRPLFQQATVGAPQVDTSGVTNAASERSADDTILAATFRDIKNELTVGEAVDVDGVGTPGSTVMLYLDGTLFETLTISSAGDWSTQITTLDSAGQYTLEAKTRSADGMIVSDAVDSVSIDILPAPVVLMPPAFDTLSTAEYEVGDILSLSGAGTAGSVITVMSNGIEAGKAIVDADGRWSHEVELSAAGTLALSAVANDASGNTARNSEALTVVVAEPIYIPTTPIMNPLALEEPFTGGEITVSGSADPATIVGILLNGRIYDIVTANADGEWAYFLPITQVGSHSIAAQIIDPDITDVIVSEEIVFEVTDVQADVSEEALAADPAPAEVVDPIVEETVEEGPVAADSAPTLLVPDVPDFFNGGALALSGFGTPGSELRIIVNRQLLASTSVNSDGVWGFMTEFTEPDTYTFYAEGLDSDGSVLFVSEPRTLFIYPDDAAENTANARCQGFTPPGEFLPDNQYRIADCETFASIARRAGITVSELTAANPELENTGLIVVGQLLTLPSLDAEN